MRTLVEEYPCDIILSDEFTPVLAGSRHAYSNALGALARAVEDKEGMDGLWARADGVRRAASAPWRIDAVLMPVCLREGEATREKKKAAAALRWAFEGVGVALLVPITGEGGPALSVLRDSRLTLAAMHEGDAERREKAWRARWEHLLAQEAAFGKRSPERGLVARYVLDDSEVIARIGTSDPGWLAILRAEGSGLAPIPWREAVRLNLKRPDA